MVSLVALVVGAAAAAAAAAPTDPQQVHLALGLTPDVMAVGWVTNTSAAAEATVEWGLDPIAFTKGTSATTGATNTSRGVGTKFTSDPGRTFVNYVAQMAGLAPLTKYYYRVGGPSTGWSQLFHFTSQVTDALAEANLPQVHLIYGDMGAAYAFSLCPDCNSTANCTCTNTSAGIISEVGRASMILHVGDFAYDFDSEGGVIGDIFMRNIEPVAAYVPYMVSVGNHENSPVSKAHFTERFANMPANSDTVPTVSTVNGKQKNNWFFSWNDGLVHYVSVSTEIQAAAVNQELIARQWEWLKADLIKANQNRDKQPWILVNGHRAMYCSCDKDCDASAMQQRNGFSLTGLYGFEKLFFEQGVDFFINGHEHDYERTWPVYKGKTDQSNVDPKATIYVTTGSAGCKELHEPFQKTQPPFSSFRSNSFGYSKLIVHNKSHAQWQQIQTDPMYFPNSYGEIIDDVYVVQNNHGPFSLASAPAGVSERDAIKGKQYDHWVGVPHPRAGIELPEGFEWRHQDANTSYTRFYDAFGGALWEMTERSIPTAEEASRGKMVQTTELAKVAHRK